MSKNNGDLPPRVPTSSQGENGQQQQLPPRTRARRGSSQLSQTGTVETASIHSGSSRGSGSQRALRVSNNENDYDRNVDIEFIDIQRRRGRSRGPRSSDTSAGVDAGGTNPNAVRKRSTSRARSSSKARSSSRARSVSRSREEAIAPIIQPFEIEPNVHHDSIQTLEIDGPVIAEMKENELFARKAGVNFTREGGDYLTIIPEVNKKKVQDGSYYANMQLSPKNYNTTFFESEGEFPPNATFLHSEDMKQMIGSDLDFAQLRMVAGQLCVDWKGREFIAPALARRLRDFQFAQEQRRKKFGNERPWGIMGLYDHLASVRMDVEWAEDAACRRANGEPYKAWFEFVEEKKTGYNRPFFTYIIVLTCTAFLIASIGVNKWSVEPFSINPMIGPSADTLVSLGAKDSVLIVQEREVFRLVSPMVLHAGLIHYILNMFALWFVGSAVELCHGFWQTVLLFVIPAIGGTILSAIFLPNYISVGASGGIFGLIGACLADVVMNWHILFNSFVSGNNTRRHAVILLVLILDIVVNSLIGLTPFVDNFTHLGGMVFGFLVGTSLMKRVNTDMFGDIQLTNCFTTFRRTASRLLGLIITLACMITATVILFEGDGTKTPCKSCGFLSCMTFPPWAPDDKKWWYCDDCGIVTADARIDPVTNVFDQITLFCPEGNTEIIPLDTDMNYGKQWLEKNLPSYCRTYCEN